MLWMLHLMLVTLVVTFKAKGTPASAFLMVKMTVKLALFAHAVTLPGPPTVKPADGLYGTNTLNVWLPVQLPEVIRSMLRPAAGQPVAGLLQLTDTLPPAAPGGSKDGQKRC